MIEFLKFLWERYVLRCRNIGWGYCNWGCDLAAFEGYAPKRKQRILIDEGMCRECYWGDYVENYK